MPLIINKAIAGKPFGLHEIEQFISYYLVVLALIPFTLIDLE